MSDVDISRLRGMEAIRCRGWAPLSRRLLLVSLVLCAASGRADDSGPQLLYAGIFHGDEVEATSSSDWLCLTSDERGTDLVSCSIEVTGTYDAVLEDDSGKEVSIPGHTDVVVALRGVPGLSRGRVRTVFLGEIPLERQMDIPLDSRDARSFVSLVATSNGYELAYSRGHHEQILATMTCIDPDGAPSLLWAGDLNRDGHLDLLMDMANHYNVSGWTLFLSDEDRGGDLVEVASFRTVGC